MAVGIDDEGEWAQHEHEQPLARRQPHRQRRGVVQEEAETNNGLVRVAVARLWRERDQTAGEKLGRGARRRGNCIIRIIIKEITRQRSQPEGRGPHISGHAS